MNQLIHGNSLKYLPTIPDESIDLICIDPPYCNIAKESWDCFHSEQEYLTWCLGWTKECLRILKHGGGLYVFGVNGRDNFIFWDFVKQTSQLLTFSSYINWKRFRPKAFRVQTTTWPSTKEDIAYFFKGDKPKCFNRQYMNEAGLSSTSKKKYEETGVGLSCGDVWVDIPECALDGGLNRTLSHPSQKPIKLMERMICASSNEGDIVLDFFAGSGTTGIACGLSNREFILVEQDPKYIELITYRLSNEFGLFPIEYKFDNHPNVMI
jgi:site-specific DNA-methyltransferase (adenine-specific)